jgi:hypothetical protein
MSQDNMPKGDEKGLMMSTETEDKEHKATGPPSPTSDIVASTIAQDRVSNATTDDEDNEKESTLNEEKTRSKYEKRLAMKRFSARQGRIRQKELIASLDREVLQLSRKVQGLQEANDGLQRCENELIASLNREVFQLSIKVQGLQEANDGLKRCVAKMGSGLVQADETIEILKGRALSHEGQAFASTHLIREMYEQPALRGAAAVNRLPPPQSSPLRAPLTPPLRQRLPELQESRITEMMAQTRKQNELVHHILVRGATAGGSALTAASSQADPFCSYLNNGANTRTNPFALVRFF